MSNAPIPVSIQCPACGSRKLNIPSPLHDEAILNCGGCSEPIGTWRAIQDQARAFVQGRHPRRAQFRGYKDWQQKR